MTGFAIRNELRTIAITEMGHAELMAERLAYLGGTPTTKPEPMFVGGDTKEMLQRDKKDEEGAIELYRKTIDVARMEGDIRTEKLFEQILIDEENHHDIFTGLLEGM